jgi:hypothetical protein
MEHEGSLLCSQKSDTGSCPAPIESSTQSHNTISQINFNIILRLRSGLFPGTTLSHPISQINFNIILGLISPFKFYN